MTVSSRQSRTPLDFFKKLIRCLQWFLMWFDSTCRYTQNILKRNRGGVNHFFLQNKLVYPLVSLLGG